MDKKAFFARTMHTPDDPKRAEQRAALREISKLLIPLHRSLINATRDDYAFGYEPVDGPNHLLRLLQEHPYFEWLKPMTALIVSIDEMARTDFEPADVASIADRVERFFGPTADQAFLDRYTPILQRDIDTAAGHAAIKQAMRKLRA